ncbi:MAG: cation transporter [Candidatus Aminicenantes bacterium]|nr:cation transporter [Candidatus Aminicenantes bacterium]
MKKNMKALYRKGLRLEYFTVAYNTVEAVFAIVFGKMANSIALIGFGLDSIVESLSGVVLIWRLHKHGKISEEEEERVERKAMKFVALTFFILGGYVLVQSLKKLVTKEIPDPSLPGIILAVVSIIVMPFLGLQKVKIGKQIKSQALIADAKETFACALLSVALLLGLSLNYALGIWQADALAGLVIVIFLFREGRESWEEATNP